MEGAPTTVLLTIHTTNLLQSHPSIRTSLISPSPPHQPPISPPSPAHPRQAAAKSR
ncbi:hypothetical protein O988_05642, partial [Pseudogymnoascus sp. VKM F-3808]